MSYCLNPICPKPENPPDNKFCITCGTKLLLSDRYRCLRLIGQGGFGRTFLAEDEYKPSKPRCVVKQFFPETESLKAKELFAQEAIRLEQLEKHPQIPNLYAYFIYNNRQYIIQEFINGDNLEQELNNEGVFNEEQIKLILLDLLPVLKFIHQGHIIHRDIKPANIIRRHLDRKLVLVDFGAAKQATVTALSKTGTSIGSAEFVAPEQMRGQPIFASDIYSLGVTCFHLLTQISPFELYNIHEDKWIWRDYLINNNISDRLGKILEKMANNSLRERYKNIDEILKDLNENSPILNIPQNQVKPINFNQKKSFSNKQRIGLKCEKTLTSHKSFVRCIKFSPDGNLLASGGWSSDVILWNFPEGTIYHFLKKEYSSCYSLNFSHDGENIATGYDNNLIMIWDCKTGNISQQLQGHTGVFSGVNTVIFSNNNKYLISGGGDKTIRVWSLKNSKEIYILRGHTRWISCVNISPNGEIIVSSSPDKNIKLWELDTGNEITTLQGHKGLFAGVNEVVFTPDGQYLLSASDDYTVKLWDLNKQQELKNFTSHETFIYSLAINNDGEIFATGDGNGIIKIWNLYQEKPLCSLQAHQGAIHTITFSPDGQWLVSGSDDNTIKIWSWN
jgi:WD40 repeat protein